MKIPHVAGLAIRIGVVVLFPVLSVLLVSVASEAAERTTRGSTLIFADGFENGLGAWNGSTGSWAVHYTFDGDPAAPSQELLPGDMDFVVTHRTHPRDHLPAFSGFPADHGSDCAGPVPSAVSGVAEPQHQVYTRHDSNGSEPDPSFFLCKNHMMSAMGDVEGYSVTAFYPRQEFDFADGGVLEFDVNINDRHARSWWEVLIAPREQMKVGAARSWLPIDETYPKDRIVLEFSPSSARSISVGTGALDPEGWLVDEHDWRQWRYEHPSDPALEDRRIRRTMRVELNEHSIRWGIETEAGGFDWYEVAVPQGLPFDRGLVLFKTHAYTPEKDENFDLYTYHWDNLRWDGPVVGRYDVFETDQLVYLQANGSRQIGETETATIEIPLGRAVEDPVLFGQIHSPMNGQVLVSVNGGPDRAVHPQDYVDDGGLGSNCLASGWSSFRLPLPPAEIVNGTNTFTWKIGPRPACATNSWHWDGFSIKSLELQVSASP